MVDTAATGTVIGSGAGNTISDNTGGGVLETETCADSITGNAISDNAGGGVVAAAAPGFSCATPTPGGDSITNNTISGASSAGIQLEIEGQFTITGNNIQTAESGPASSPSVLPGTRSRPHGHELEAGVYIGGNDLTGPSESNNVDNNAFSTNELAGGVADGSGSPESWTGPVPATRASRARSSSSRTRM